MGCCAAARLAPHSFALGVFRIYSMIFRILAGSVLGMICFPVFAETCINKVINEEYSPNNNFKAILFERECEEKTLPTVEVTILLSDVEFGDEEGNVYISEGYPEHYDIKWNSELVLSISGNPWNVWSKADETFVFDPEKNMVYTVEVIYE